MPKLGEFLGALLSDVAQARVLADLETIRIAEAYSGHGMLKHLPVPRFRLPDLTVDVPVLVTAVGGLSGEPGGRQFSEPTASEVAVVVREGLRVGDIHFARGEAAKVTAVATQRMKELFERGPEVLLTPASISAEVTAAVIEAASALVADDAMKERLPIAESSIRAGLEKLMVSRLVQSPYLEVLVTSGEIKSHADNETVVRVRLNISEDSYEVIERDDGQGIILTPE